MNPPPRALFAARVLATLVFGFMGGLGAVHADVSAAPIQGSWLSQQDLLTIGIDQRLGAQVPAGLRFTDSTGEPVDFDTLLARKPTILTLVYYNCPNLCTLVLNGVVLSMGDLRRDLGNGFQVVSVSIDPGETPAQAAQKKTTYLRRYGRGGTADENWHFLTGDPADIAALAAAVGYRYRYDPAIHQFAHGSGIMVLDEQRRLVKYFLGIEYPPAELEKALVLAQRGGTGSPAQNFLLLCYCYNPLTGPYGFLIFTILKVAAAATVLVLGGFIVWQLRRELRGRALP
jgi:protein SCO1/2